MEHDRIAADNMVRRYLRGDLSVGEAKTFERHYLTCQQCLDEMAASQALRDGLTELVETGYLQRPADGGGSRPAWLSMPVWAAAATVLLAVSLVTNALLLSQREQPPAAGRAEVFNLVTVRDASGEPVNSVVPAAGTDTVVLTVDTGRLDDAGPFDVTIVPEASPAELLRLGPLSAGADGRIAVSLPMARLVPGINRVDVSEHQASAVLNSARFVWSQ